VRGGVEGASVCRVVAVENHNLPGDKENGRRRQKTTNTMSLSSKQEQTRSKNTTTTPNTRTNKTKTKNKKREDQPDEESFGECGEVAGQQQLQNKYKDKQPTATKVKNPNRQPGPENRSAGRFPDSELT